ncbi:hypothetical protein QAD02_013715 [Eretmocerus hayati]|uniref:Uncharacterized protein n=1 Tax=Eretmocerus hayati TaxID=131215 RepID=A0ACC2P497_9HYME|nr:hypothetical protein QAD02_013715 [Eretmocerus hayati]
MLFDFLKKLFWRANEGAAKRRASADDTNEETVQSKRCRYRLIDYDSRAMNSSIESPDGDRCIPLVACESVPAFVDPLPNKNHESLLQTSNSPRAHTVSIDQYVENNIIKRNVGVEDCRIGYMKGHNQESVLKLRPMKAQKMDTTNYSESMSHGDVGSNERFLHYSLIEADPLITKWFGDLCPSDRKNQLTANQETVQKSHFPSTFYLSRFRCQNSGRDLDLWNRMGPNSFLRCNTLKEKLSSKHVTKRDFVIQIANRYEKREEQCFSELHELHRMTDVLAKHNRYLWESALEKSLNRSLLMIEAVLDEKHEKYSLELPELSPDMMRLVQHALANGYEDEILSEKYGLRITRKDIRTLAGLNWLNDEVINFYMNLLITRGENDNYPNVYAMNTFFYPKLISGGHTSLKRWTRKIDIFSKDIVVIPIHLGVHWCMSIIDFRYKSIQYYDSMGSPNNKCLCLLKQYIHEESIDKKKKPYSFQDWNFECVQNIPRQTNGSDCGVFSCMFAEYICSNRELNFSQDNMPYFRNKMIYEILTAKLL